MKDKSSRQVRSCLLTAAAGIALVAVPLPGETLTEFRLTGSILGVVNNAAGVPQMGAAVHLVNRYHRLVAQVVSDERGGFRFDGVAPDVYTLRVSLANFFTATRANIGIQPGIHQMVTVNLVSAINSVELLYPAAGQLAIGDDWKWVLRTSTATRPILRALPQPDWGMKERSALFSNTTGMVRLSAGDTTFMPTLGSQPDLGTAFALVTSLYGTNRLQFSGNLGYASQWGIPAAGFRTTFSRQTETGWTPEITVTMRQLFLASRNNPSQPDSVPGLRTMSATIAERTQLTENLRLDYGSTLDSVSYVQRLNYLSPYAKLNYRIGKDSEVEAAYSSGLPPVELLARNLAEGDWGGQANLAGLSLFPKVSERNGQARIQRVENFEVGYRRKAGSRMFSVGAYRESVTNAALMATSSDGTFPNRDFLPDVFSSGAIFNAGRYSSIGYTGSLTQTLGEKWSATLAYGTGGVLQLARSRMLTNDPDELRNMVREERRHWVTTRITGVTPVTKTKVAASYQWTNSSGLTPGHYYLTQSLQPEPGFNVVVRQRIPAPSGMPGKLEATAELRNMLAQGYLPVTAMDGQKLLLIHTPRALRGGLAFIF